MPNRHVVCLAAAVCVHLALGGSASAAVVKDYFHGECHWPTVSWPAFEGMQADTPQPHLTDKVTGWVLYNTDELPSGSTRKAILIGDRFAAPGFDFELVMGNLRLTKQSISQPFPNDPDNPANQNHATIQFKGSTFEGLFGQLDFVGSDGRTYRVEQSGFQWEIKRVVNGTTELQPIKCSGYWVYQTIDRRENLDYTPPHAVIDGVSHFSASNQQVILDSSQSYIPVENPGVIDSRLWTGDGRTLGSGQTLTLDCGDFDFEHPGDGVDVTLAVTDTFYQTGEESVRIHYANTNPTFHSFNAVSNGHGGMVFTASYSDPDLNAPQAQGNPDFEKINLRFSYDNKTFLVGEGTLSYQEVMDVFGGEGRYMVFASLSDRTSPITMKNKYITVTVPEPATLCLLALGALIALYRRRRHSAV